MKKIMLFLFVFMLILPVAFSQQSRPFQQSDTTIGYDIELVNPLNIKLNTEHDFHIHVYNSSNGVPINSSTTCEIHLYDITGEQIYETKKSTAIGWEYSFMLSNNNFTQIGTYKTVAFCYNLTKGIGGYIANNFEVNKNGKEQIEPGWFIFGVALIIFILLYFTFNLSQDHLFLKLLSIFFSITLLILIPSINLITNGTDILYKAMTWYVRLFFTYIIVYLGYRALKYSGSNAKK